MMDAWETLVAGSTIASGDAWEHLQAQGGGSGPGAYTILADGLEVEMSTEALELLVDQSYALYDLEVDSAQIEMLIELSELECEIDQPVQEVFV